MTATARLKQLLFLAAALALVGLGLVAAVSTASPARATDTTPCVPTQDSYTEWAQTDIILQHGDSSPPGTNTDLKEYRGPTETKDVTQEAQEGTPAQDTRVWWVFRGQNGDAAPAPDSDLWKAQPNLPADQSQHSYPGENALGNPYQPGVNAGNGDWFRFTGELIPAVEGTPEISHTDYTWTVWEREFVAGHDCPPPEECPNGDFNGADPGCGTPPEECPNGDFNGADPGCGTPPEEKPSVCHPVEGNGELGNGWNLIAPAQASSHIDESLFPDGVYWKHETSDGRHDIYSEDGETCPDPTPPVECPDGDFNGEEPGCGEPPVECPDGDFNGQEPGCGEPDPGPGTCPEDTDKAGEAIPADKTAEEFCDDDDEVCPKGTDHAGEEVKHGDDPAKVCDDDNKPPGNPDEPTPPNGPSNHPNPGPTVKGAQASAPTGSASTPTVAAAAPAAARVPSAVDAGLAPSQRDLTDNGGPLGLLGIAAALLGAGLVGASLRPRRGRSLTG
jgi:hypothetical protein